MCVSGYIKLQNYRIIESLIDKRLIPITSVSFDSKNKIDLKNIYIFLYNKEMSLQNLSIEELKKIKQDKKDNLKKKYNEYKKEKQKLIAEIQGIEKETKKIEKKR